MEQECKSNETTPKSGGSKMEESITPSDLLSAMKIKEFLLLTRSNYPEQSCCYLCGSDWRARPHDVVYEESGSTGDDPNVISLDCPFYVRNALVDPLVNLQVKELRQKITERDAEIRKLKEEIQSGNFAPDNIMGKRLIQKCRNLQEENSELGKIILERQVQPLQNQITSLKKQLTQRKDLLRSLQELNNDLDEENEALSYQLHIFSQKLKELSEKNEGLQKAGDDLKIEIESMKKNQTESAKAKPPRSKEKSLPDSAERRIPERAEREKDRWNEKPKKEDRKLSMSVKEKKYSEKKK